MGHEGSPVPLVETTKSDYLRSPAAAVDHRS
jgi:hypothetical protein